MSLAVTSPPVTSVIFLMVSRVGLLCPLRQRHTVTKFTPNSLLNLRSRARHISSGHFFSIHSFNSMFITVWETALTVKIFSKACAVGVLTVDSL